MISNLIADFQCLHGYDKRFFWVQSLNEQRWYLAKEMLCLLSRQICQYALG